MPIVGPLLGAMMAGLVALTSGQGLARLVAILLLFVVIKLVDDTVIQPLTIGRSVHLHPVLVLFAILAGGAIAGLAGLLLGIPIVGVMRLVLRYLYRKLIDAPEPPLPPVMPPPAQPTPIDRPLQPPPLAARHLRKRRS